MSDYVVINGELYHYGVKGMKWGVRKKYYKSYMDNDRVLKKGFNVQNISANKARDLSRNDPVYTSHTVHDNNAYSGRYAKNINLMGDKAIKNSIVLTKDVKIPSQKKAVELFKTNDNKFGLSNSYPYFILECEDYIKGCDNYLNQ